MSGTEAAGGTDPAAGLEEGPSLWGRLPTWLRFLILVGLSFAIAWIVVQLVGSIDWAAVVSSLQRLSAWQVVPLAAGLLVRQSLNAVPLDLFVPHLGFRRSLQNDLAANLVGTVAPPPGDVVLRVSMFRSWGIDPVDGMAGVTLNMFAFYSVRFLAPTVGLLVLSVEELESGHVVAAATSALVAVAVLVGLALVARGDRLAALVGRTAGRVVGRFRAGVDAESWAGEVVAFRGRMAHTLRAGLPRSMLALLLMVLSDALLLLMALRFVGVGSSALSVAQVVGAFLIVYPLTLMPLFGLGVLDAALLAAWTEVAGTDFEPEIVAALVVWRVVTLLGPLVLGTASLLWWRRSKGITGPLSSQLRA